jgi:hypothetical protein
LLTICDSSVQDLLIVQHPFFWHFPAFTHACVLRQVEDFLGHIPRRIISTQSLGGRCMSDEWIKTLADRRRVKFTTQELDEKAFLTAQVEGSKVVYSIILTNAKNPLSREEVETHFEGELSKRSPKSN